MSTDTQNKSITLYFREGGSDKVYQTGVWPNGSGFVVNFAFGRRGTTLQTGTKTAIPVDYQAAVKVYDKLVREKMAIGVVVCSDHGYTELPSGTGFTVAPPLSHCDTSHGRIAELPAASASIHDDHFIPLDEKLTSDLETVYFVSKGYTCVGTKPRGAVHGGLTPQEVYVPQIVVATEAPAGYADIQVVLTGAVRRGRAGNPIVVRIMNPNTVAVDLLELTIDIVTLATVVPCTVGPGGTLDLAGTVDARQVASERLQLGGCARVDCMGDVSTTEFRVQMQSTGAAVVDRSFEDGFDV